MPASFPRAFPVADLAVSRQFYGQVVGCTECLRASDWVDFDLYGQQLVALLAAGDAPPCGDQRGFDFGAVPLQHIDAELPLAQWDALVQRLHAARVAFVVEPQIREQEADGPLAVMAFLDPFGNALRLRAAALATSIRCCEPLAADRPPA